MTMDKNLAKKINVEGMTCHHCSATVEKAIKSVSGVDEVEIDLKGNCAYVTGDFERKNVHSAIEDAGYKVSQN